MNDWWKAPVLQGEDNDYGDYDYLINPIPQNQTYWSTWGYKCESCGKYHRINLISDQYFYTLDGYDSLSYHECLSCVLKTKIHHYKYLICQELESRRWKFFANNKWGRKIVSFAFKLSKKYPNSRFCSKLCMATLPF